MAQFEKLDEYLIVNTNTKNGMLSAKSLCNALVLVDDLNQKCIEHSTATRYKVIVKPDWEWIGWDEVKILVDI
jgi:hypothetical protein